MTAISPEEIKALVRDMEFGTDGKVKQAKIRELAYANGLFFASIQNLYDAMGKNTAASPSPRSTSAASPSILPGQLLEPR